MNRLAPLFENSQPPRRQEPDWKPPLSFTSLCLVQGAYYLTLGLWELLSPVEGAVEASQGRAVGFLVMADAILLLCAAWRRQSTPEIAVVAMGSALALTSLDALHSFSGLPVFMDFLDALAEMLLFAAWVRLLKPQKPSDALPIFRLPLSQPRTARVLR